jgi:hypothetical protein
MSDPGGMRYARNVRPLIAGCFLDLDLTIKDKAKDNSQKPTGFAYHSYLNRLARVKHPVDLEVRQTIKR